ncbi:MAG: hypothetical protein ABFC24_09330 [Methanoregulaceae archaeon]
MSPDILKLTIFQDPRIGYLVPVLSFGGTIAGILLTFLGFPIEIQYAAFGSVLGSVLLAILAFIRPRKDIVAISTPVYAVIFFVFPIGFLPGVVIQLIFAAGLTILLVRLQMRFGEADVPRPGNSLSAPLQEYVDRIRGLFPDQPGFVADGGGEAFALFARGDYREAADITDLVVRDLAEKTDDGIVTRAFSIVSEQARHMEHTLDLPAAYLKFLPEHSRFLAHTDPAPNPEKEYYRTLYNALLILYALSWNRDPEERTHLLKYRDFAEKLFIG